MQRGYLTGILLMVVLAGYQANLSAQGSIVLQPAQVRELERGTGNHTGRKVGFSLDKITKTPSQAEKTDSPPAREIWSQFFTGKRDTLATESSSRYRFSLGTASHANAPTNETAGAAQRRLPQVLVQNPAGEPSQGISQQPYRNELPESVSFEPRIVYVPVYSAPAQPAQDTLSVADGEAGQFNDNSAVAMVPLRPMPSSSGISHTNRKEQTAMSETVQVPRDRVRLVSGSAPATEIPEITPLPTNRPPKVYRPQ